jgi:hypothetical protein
MKNWPRPWLLKDRGGDLHDNTIGALCARDYKGVGNQYVDEGKLVIEVENGNLERYRGV